MNLNIALILISCLLMFSCSTTKTIFTPPDDFHSLAKSKSLEYALDEYLKTITKSKYVKSSYQVIFKSKGYGAFPFYEQLHTQKAYTRMCEDRGGQYSDKTTQFKTGKFRFLCQMPNSTESRYLDFVQQGTKITLTHFTIKELEQSEEQKRKAIKYDFERDRALHEARKELQRIRATGARICKLKGNPVVVGNTEEAGEKNIKIRLENGEIIWDSPSNWRSCPVK